MSPTELVIFHRTGKSMSFYGTCIVPHLVHLAMRNRRLLPYRERTISAAEGTVLEIGIGSGLNLPFYGDRVKEIIGLEPAPRLLSMARDQARRVSLPVKFIEGSAESIPLERPRVASATPRSRYAE